MLTNHTAAGRLGFLMTGAMLALTTAPVHAAVALELPDSSRVILACSLVLLVAALTLRIGRRRHEGDADPHGPDMRWWRAEES